MAAYLWWIPIAFVLVPLYVYSCFRLWYVARPLFPVGLVVAAILFPPFAPLLWLYVLAPPLLTSPVVVVTRPEK